MARLMTVRGAGQVVLAGEGEGRVEGRQSWSRRGGTGREEWRLTTGERNEGQGMETNFQREERLTIGESEDRQKITILRSGFAADCFFRPLERATSFSCTKKLLSNFVSSSVMLTYIGN
jgi:hypothetical protein